MSVISRTPVNIVQEEIVLSTSSAGIDFVFPTIMLTAFGVGVLCEPDVLLVSEEENTTLPLDLNSSVTKKQMGWLVLHCNQP